MESTRAHAMSKSRSSDHSVTHVGPYQPPRQPEAHGARPRSPFLLHPSTPGGELHKTRLTHLHYLCHRCQGKGGVPQASASDLGGCGLSKRPSDPAKTQEGEGGGGWKCIRVQDRGRSPGAPKDDGGCPAWKQWGRGRSRGKRGCRWAGGVGGAWRPQVPQVPVGVAAVAGWKKKKTE